MKKFKLYAMGLAMAGALSFTSCSDDYLDTNPTNQISDQTMTSVDALYLGLNGIHRQMISQESGYQCMGGLGGMMYIMDIEADDITWITNTWMKAAYLGWQCNMNGQNGYNEVFWRLYYQWIMNANRLLAAAEEINYEALSNDDKAVYEQVKGEALVFRAFAHFQAVQTYADAYKAGQNNTQLGVPYRKVDTMTGDLARSTVEDTYKYINDDLKEACELLEGKDITEYNHFSAKSAYAIRARVAMAMQNYTDAATYAKKSIDLSKAEGRALMEGDELFCGFAKITQDTKEPLYAAMTKDDQTIYFYSFYAYMSWNFNATAIRQGVKAINADTYDTMSATDLRRAWWDPSGTMSVPATSYVKNEYQNRKFRAVTTGSAVGDVAFLRLSEMYLTLAEAYARMGGKDTEAQEVFAEFQVTRDPSYTSSTNLIEDIMNSRRIELWGEGLRFFDLKRLGLDIKRGRNFDKSFCTFLEKKADEDGWTWEIPITETNYNELCEKNY